MVVCRQAINEIICFCEFYLCVEVFETIEASVDKLNRMATISIHGNFTVKLLNIKAISTINFMFELIVSVIRDRKRRHSSQNFKSLIHYYYYLLFYMNMFSLLNIVNKYACLTFFHSSSLPQCGRRIPRKLYLRYFSYSGSPMSIVFKPNFVS